MTGEDSERVSQAERRRDSEPAPPKRPYASPELREFGSLRELTHNLSPGAPGDGLGGSVFV